MRENIGTYHVVDLPPARRETPNLANLIWWWKHSVYGFLEVDVTLARGLIAEYKKWTGEPLSFTGYLVFCLAQAVDEDKSVQAYLKGRKQVVLFEDVDVGLPIEREIGGKRVPIGYVIRRANHKTFLEIHKEIRSVQAQPVPARKGMESWLRFLLMLPWPLPNLFNVLLRAAMRRNPNLLVSRSGTVGVTAVGMFSRTGGWGLTPPVHSLFLIVGGISRKPAVVDDRIEPREIINLTVSFDHDVVDGAPAARFVHRLVELIESGYGLAEIEKASQVQIGMPV